MPAYPSESWWTVFLQDVEALYQSRRELIDTEAIWYLTKAAHAIGTGEDPEIAKAKQLAQARTALGLLDRGSGRNWGKIGPRRTH